MGYSPWDHKSCRRLSGYTTTTKLSSTLTPEQSLFSTGMVSIKHTAVFLPLGVLGGTSAWHLGAVFNGKIINKEHKDVANEALC